METKIKRVVSNETRQKMSESHKGNPRKKNFSKELADKVREEYGTKVTYKSLAQKYGVSSLYIFRIMKNKIWNQ